MFGVCIYCRALFGIFDVVTTVDTVNKRQCSGDDTPPKQAQKKTKGKTKVINEGTVCCICEDSIKIMSETNEGDDTVFCEGFCQAWAHRKCISLSKQLYKVISESDDLFLCSYCSLAYYQRKKSILYLQKLSSLKIRTLYLILMTVHTLASNHTDSADYTSTSQPCTSQTHNLPPQDISKLVTSEEKEREKWRLNLIIHK